MRKRRPPLWLTITLGLFTVLFVLGAIFGGQSPSTGATTAAGPTTATPPMRTYTVTRVDGATVELTDTTGATLNVQAAGIAMPTAPHCFGAEASSWASAFLTGKRVTAKTTDTLAVITLSDGTSYSAVALDTGHAKYVTDAFAEGYGPSLQAAEQAARTNGTGLWGPPCNGNIDAPAAAQSVPSTTTTTPTTTETPPVEQAAAPVAPTLAPTGTTTRRDVHYDNCAEVHAAGITTLRRGDPGYSRRLDRDGDGIACN